MIEIDNVIIKAFDYKEPNVTIFNVTFDGNTYEFTNKHKYIGKLITYDLVPYTYGIFFNSIKYRYKIGLSPAITLNILKERIIEYKQKEYAEKLELDKALSIEENKLKERLNLSNDDILVLKRILNYN